MVELKYAEKEPKLKAKVLIIIGVILTISIFGFFLLRNEVQRKTEIEAIELTLSLGQISKEIYRDKGVYVEVLIRKGKKKYVIDLTTKERGIKEPVWMKITPFFSQEKVNQLNEETEGNLKDANEVREIFRYTYEKVKKAHPEVPELYEASVKIIPPDVDIEEKLADIDEQLMSLEQQLKTLKSNK